MRAIEFTQPGPPDVLHRPAHGVLKLLRYGAWGVIYFINGAGFGADRVVDLIGHLCPHRDAVNDAHVRHNAGLYHGVGRYVSNCDYFFISS